MKTNRFKNAQAFTLVEMLVVITIILVLAAILLNVSGYVNNKAARSRAEGEIRAISTALESYKADNGTYPLPLLTANSRQAPKTGFTGAATYIEDQYRQALYEGLTGDGDEMLGTANAGKNNTGNNKSNWGTSGKCYIQDAAATIIGSVSVKDPNAPPPPPGGNAAYLYPGAFKDPWGSDYFYVPGDLPPNSGGTYIGPAGGGMPSGYTVRNLGGFDLFTQAGTTSTTDPPWVKNW